MAVGCNAAGEPAPDAPDGGACPLAAAAPPAPRLDLAVPLSPAARAAGGGPVSLPRIATGPLHRVERPGGDTTRRAAAAAPSRAALDLLILAGDGEEPSFGAARAALERLGAPYQTFVATEEELNGEVLFDEEGGCRYRGVILVSGFLEIETEEDTWESALSAEEWDRLADFELTCGARELVLYSWGSDELGLAGEGSFDGETAVEATVTPAGAEIFGYLAGDVQIPIRDTYGYRTRILDAAATTPILTTPEGDVLGVIHHRPDGRETLALTFDSSIYSLHAQLLEYGLVHWLSRGLFLGERRVYLTPQVDDVFLDTEMWVPGKGVDPSVTYRLGPEALRWVADWHEDFRADLPQGSEVSTYLAFNGIGTDPEYYPKTDLIDAAREVQDSFAWVNHTWDHTNMDRMTRDHARLEISENCALGEDWGMPGMSCAELVTPEISGLDNPDAVAGMAEAGVRYVVSDTSETAELNPDNPGTNPAHNVGRPNPSEPTLYQVPRHPTNIFYDVSTPEEQVDLFNYLYRDEIGRELTYDEILDREAEVALHYLLSYDIDPLMFHQANFRTFTAEDASVHTLYTDWMERVVERYRKLVALPLRSLPLAEIGERMKERGSYLGCNVRAIVVDDAEGRRLELTGTGACTVPITGLDAPDAGRVDLYDGVPTTYVELDPCAPTVIPLED